MAVIKFYNNFGFYTFKVNDTYGGVSALRRSFPSLVPIGDGEWTYPLLAGLDDYSIEGASYGGLTALKTYSGAPWAVMEANGFTYDVQGNKLVRLAQVVGSIADGGIYFYKHYLLQDGVITPNGRIRRYTCKYDTDIGQYFYYDVGISEV